MEKVLSEALALLKDDVEKNDGANLEELVDKINKESGIEKDLLVLFANLFAERVHIAKQKNISLEDREIKDWMRPEVEIIMLYMESRKKYEKIGVKEAFENLADLLGKTPLGVQYKYYDERKVLKNPDMKRGKRGRKPKEETEKELSKEEKEVTSSSILEKRDLNEEKTIMENFDLLQDGFDKNRIEKVMLTEEDLSVNLPSTQELDMIQMLSGMINNFKILSEFTGDKNAETMRRIVEGIYVLSSIAASTANDAGRTRFLKNKMKELTEENERLRNVNKEIKENYRALIDKIRDFKESSDTEKIANLYTFLDEIEKEALESGMYVSTIESYELNKEGQVVGIRNR